MKTTIEVRKKGKVNILEFSGSMKTGEGDVLLREKMTQLLGAGERLFIFDMTKVPWMDSGALAEVIVCQKHVSEQEGTIKLVLSQWVHDLFIMTRLSGVFEIFEDVEDALASFANG